MTKNPVPVRLDDETRRQINDLARWWNLQSRYTADVITRCIERVWTEEQIKHGSKDYDNSH